MNVLRFLALHFTALALAPMLLVAWSRIRRPRTFRAAVPLPAVDRPVVVDEADPRGGAKPLGQVRARGGQDPRRA